MMRSTLLGVCIGGAIALGRVYLASGAGSAVAEDIGLGVDRSWLERTFDVCRPVEVPAEYGELVAVDSGMLWFEDESGVLRNVIVRTHLVQVERK